MKIRRYILQLSLTLAATFFSLFVFGQNDTVDIPTYWHKPENIGDSTLKKFAVYKYGAEKGMIKFLNENLKNPNDSIKGTVLVNFIIDTLGLVRSPKIINGLSKEADAEVLRVVKMLEFYPAMANGKKVAVEYNLPVGFLPDKNRKNKKK